MKVQLGHIVKAHYVGILNDGTEFDNSYVRGEPIEFEVGAGQMIIGFERAVMNMEVGETKKHVTIPCHQGYGDRNENAIQEVPRAAFRPDFEFEAGGVIQGNGPHGPFIATIREFNDESVFLDMNHPLAGEILFFDIEIISIHDPTAVEEEPVLAEWNKSMKKAELLEVAKTRGLGVNTRSTKAQIIEALEA
tara:strand:+ start:1537 stop:2112 length:576 start_codon:yes stop_codon:yes gene_type:complete